MYPVLVLAATGVLASESQLVTFTGSDSIKIENTLLAFEPNSLSVKRTAQELHPSTTSSPWTTKTRQYHCLRQQN